MIRHLPLIAFIILTALACVWAYGLNQDNDSLRAKVATERQRTAALQDSSRLQMQYADSVTNQLRSVQALLALPVESVEARVESEVRRRVKQASAEITSYAEARWRADSSRIAGNILADMASTNDSLLVFSVRDTSSFFAFDGRFAITPSPPSMQYEILVFPQWQLIRIYQVETRDGMIETWIDAEGETKIVSSYKKEEVVAKPKPFSVTAESEITIWPGMSSWRVGPGIVLRFDDKEVSFHAGYGGTSDLVRHNSGLVGGASFRWYF